VTSTRRAAPPRDDNRLMDALMRQIRIGDITIDAVIEREGP